MSEDLHDWARISIRPTHGTARCVAIPSVVPKDKKAKEEFWVKELMNHLPEYKDSEFSVRANEDDSSGGHDVILTLDGAEIGVQVTELTNSFTRERENVRLRYLDKIIAILRKREITASRKMMVNILLYQVDLQRAIRTDPNELVDVIAANLEFDCECKTISFSQGNIIIQPVTQGEIYTCIIRSKSHSKNGASRTGKPEHVAQ